METMMDILNGAPTSDSESRYLSGPSSETSYRPPSAPSPTLITPPPPAPTPQVLANAAGIGVATKLRFIAELYAEGAVAPDAAMRLICRELNVGRQERVEAPRSEPRVEGEGDPTRLRRPARTGGAFDRLRQKRNMSWAELAKRADCSHGTARSYAQGGRVSADMEARLWAAVEA